MAAILRTQMLSTFSCLGERCEDTCCRGWSMQVDAPTLNRYKEQAPELMSAVEQAQEAPWIMRKDAETGMCVKLEGGLCGIHKKYGEQFLGDACHFYPRVTRRLGDKVIMTATMSCPEVTRLALQPESACKLQVADAERLPQSLKDYLPEGLSAEEAIIVHATFLQAADDPEVSAERAFLRIASVARTIEMIDKKSWAQGVPFYLKHADLRLLEAESDINDPFNLLHALMGLVVATKKKPPERLMQTISDMEKALAVMLDWQQVQIHTGDGSLDAYVRLQDIWREVEARYAPMLKRWLQVQLSVALFPFSGLGATFEERATIIGVRLATVKLALMCSCGIHGPALPQDVVIRVLQSLSRLMDHLGDPAFSLLIYKETGWIRESRMRGLLEQ